MINLNQTTALTKKIGTIIGVLLVILALTLLIFFRFSNKAPQKPPEALPSPTIFQNPGQNQPLSFKFPEAKNVQLPKRLPVYTETKIELSNINLKEAASLFGISQDPYLIEDTIEGKQYNWKQSSLILSINQTTLRYINNTQTFPNNRLTLPQLQAKASELINKIPFIDKSLNLDSNGIKFINIKEEDFTSALSLEDSKLVELNYFKKLNGFPVYFGQPKAPFLKIRISADGTITYFETRLYKEFSEQDHYQLTNINEAISQIKNGMGKIVQTYLPDEQGNAFELYRIQPFDIGTLNITNIYPAFFVSSDSSRLTQPIYVFEGEFTYSTNQTGKAIIYLPAIKN